MLKYNQLVNSGLFRKGLMFLALNFDGLKEQEFWVSIDVARTTCVFELFSLDGPHCWDASPPDSRLSLSLSLSLSLFRRERKNRFSMIYFRVALLALLDRYAKNGRISSDMTTIYRAL